MNNKSIGLAVSGGGIRAAIFHIGVLKWLAENNQFENIKHISSVSGGTLLIGLIFHLAGNQWPTSEVFIAEIEPKLKTIFIKTNLATLAIRKLFLPKNWRYFFSRANILAKAIESCWGIHSTLNDLASAPVWTINGTTAENGKRFRFKQSTCGDYEVGYANATHFKLAEAMAVSAAFPAVIGPLAIKMQEFKWHKSENWNDPIETAKEYIPHHKSIHIYDGGLYDNLGLEPLFDSGTQCLKDKNINFLMVSDAGSALTKTAIPFALSFSRFKHIADILSDQSRSLRIRAIVNYLINNCNNGVYLQIGQNVSHQSKKSEYEKIKNLAVCNNWQCENEINLAKNFPTTLSKISNNHFDVISQHGYEIAKWNFSVLSNSDHKQDTD